MKILAVDPGLKKIGLAVSDPTGTAARALVILEHQTVASDSARILEVAHCEKAERILLGTVHEPGSRMDELARYTHRLLAALRAAAAVPVDLQDESFSTQKAINTRRVRGERRKARRAADDALAAAAFLQEYLDDRAKAQD
jgi:putative Holliday junction resolvase